MLGYADERNLLLINVNFDESHFGHAGPCQGRTPFWWLCLPNTCESVYRAKGVCNVCLKADNCLQSVHYLCSVTERYRHTALHLAPGQFWYEKWREKWVE